MLIPLVEFDNLYFVSPKIGWPIAYNCFLSWCFLPVTGFNSTRLASEFSNKTITTTDAYNVLIALKMARQSNSYKEDNLLDAVDNAQAAYIVWDTMGFKAWSCYGGEPVPIQSISE